MLYMCRLLKFSGIYTYAFLVVGFFWLGFGLVFFFGKAYCPKWVYKPGCLHRTGVLFAIHWSWFASPGTVAAGSTARCLSPSLPPVTRAFVVLQLAKWSSGCGGETYSPGMSLFWGLAS